MEQTNARIYVTPSTNEVLFDQEGVLCASITKYGDSGYAGNLDEWNTFEF